ncbi:MAG: aldehyde ferredoxin oxidoreductase family protein [Chloroflexi bacterium]|nr:aldehyde ferredoxin oxidoreductase family protein [Chloroflexota bacterium]
MAHGFAGRILHVYLDQGRIEIETPPEAFYRKYMGGSALGAYYLLKHTPPHADPLGPENTLTLAVGVVTGAAISGNSRLAAVAKSPLTGAIGDSQSGGFFPAELKFAGFDAIVLHGRAPEPMYLWVHDGEAELRPAGHLWGKITGEVEDILKAELGDPRVQILQTGIAGEKGVRYAGLISMANRANGRTGMGAVMASKNLKAIAVRGKGRARVANPKALAAIQRWGAKAFPESDVYGLGLLGTAEITLSQSQKGGLPTRNWTSGYFEGAEKLDGRTMAKTILKERDTCYACVIRCKRVVEVNNDRFRVDPRYGGPEYETLATLGSYCGIDDLEAVAYGNQLCAMYGLDTIATGATIAWAMDCYEHGLLTREQTDGLDLHFGNAEAMIRLIEKIAHREGFGDLLAEGAGRAAEKLGVGQDLAVEVKYHALPAHMPEVKRSLGLIYAVNPFGADHQSSEHDPSYKYYPERMAQLGLTNPQEPTVLNEEKVRFALTTQYLYSALDSVTVCQFVFGPAWHLFDVQQLADTVSAVTGWDVDIPELLEVGARRLNMMRMFNAREGFTREQDQLPPKLFQPRVGGPTDGVHLTREEIEWAKDVYYRMAGWDENGIPTPERLRELGLEWILEA